MMKFPKQLMQSFQLWLEVRASTCLATLDWWEMIVKPNIKKLLINRGRELSKHKRGELNLLLIRQAYLVRKIQSGMVQFLAQLHFMQANIVTWHNN